MQIGRGLFRLWVVASVLWVLVVGVMTWQTWPAQTDFFDAFKSTPPDTDTPPWAKPDPGARDELISASYIAVAPPVAALILGMSLLWVVRGFRSK
jgi:hypothetical protein